MHAAKHYHGRSTHLSSDLIGKIYTNVKPYLKSQPDKAVKLRYGTRKRRPRLHTPAQGQVRTRTLLREGQLTMRIYVYSELK